MNIESYKIEQISVFIENKEGRFFNATKILKSANINIRAMSLADTIDFGILRFIVDNSEMAYKTLKESGFTVKKNYVIAIAVEDKVGGLSDMLKKLTDKNLNIEYMYTVINASNGKAVMIFRFENVDGAIEKLIQQHVMIIHAKEFQNM